MPWDYFEVILLCGRQHILFRPAYTTFTMFWPLTQPTHLFWNRVMPRFILHSFSVKISMVVQIRHRSRQRIEKWVRDGRLEWWDSLRCFIQILLVKLNNLWKCNVLKGIWQVHCHENYAFGVKCNGFRVDRCRAMGMSWWNADRTVGYLIDVLLIAIVEWLVRS